jgi:uncharacterized membrane protein
MRVRYILTEMLLGLKITLKYILSHHEEDKLYKCNKICNIHLCSRCLGIYTGFLVTSIIILNFKINPNKLVLLILFLPSFTLLDWFLTGFKYIKSSNLKRNISGFLLGISVILAVNRIYILKEIDFFLIIIFIGYSLLSILLIFLQIKLKLRR